MNYINNMLQGLANTPSLVYNFAESIKQGAQATIAKTKQFAINLFMFAFPYGRVEGDNYFENAKSLYKGLNSGIIKNVVILQNPLSKIEQEKEDKSLLKKACDLTKRKSEDKEGMITPKEVETIYNTSGHIFANELLLPFLVAGTTDFLGTMVATNTLQKYLLDSKSDKLSQTFIQDCGLIENPNGIIDKTVYFIGANATFQFANVLTNDHINNIPFNPFKISTLALIIVLSTPVKNRVMGSPVFRVISDKLMDCALGLRESIKAPLSGFIKTVLAKAGTVFLVDGLLKEKFEKHGYQNTKGVMRNDGSKAFAIGLEYFASTTGVFENLPSYALDLVPKFAADRIIDGITFGATKTLETGLLYQAVKSACATSPTLTFAATIAMGGPNQSIEELSLRVLSVSTLLFFGGGGYVAAIITVPSILLVDYLVRTRNGYVAMKNQENYKKIDDLNKEFTQLHWECLQTPSKELIKKIETIQIELTIRMDLCKEPETALSALGNLFYQVINVFYPGTAPQKIKEISFEEKLRESNVILDNLKKKESKASQDLTDQQNSLEQLKHEKLQLENDVSTLEKYTTVLQKETAIFKKEVSTLRNRKNLNNSTVDTNDETQPEETSKKNEKGGWFGFLNNTVLDIIGG